MVPQKNISGYFAWLKIKTIKIQPVLRDEILEAHGTNYTIIKLKESLLKAMLTKST